jgi:hypothetical protein
MGHDQCRLVLAMPIDRAKKSAGQPLGDSDPVEVRLDRATLDRLDAWQGDTSRPNVIRQLFDEKLRAYSDGS